MSFCPYCKSPPDPVFANSMWSCERRIYDETIPTKKCLEREVKAARWKLCNLNLYVSKLIDAGDACAETATTPEQIAWRKAKEAKP